MPTPDNPVRRHAESLKRGEEAPESFRDASQEELWRFAIASHVLSEGGVGGAVLDRVEAVFSQAQIDQNKLFESLLHIREAYTAALLEYFIAWGETCVRARETAVELGMPLDRMQSQLKRYDELSLRSGRTLWDKRLTPSANVLFSGCVGGLDVMFDVVLVAPLLMEQEQMRIDEDSFGHILKKTITHMYDRSRMGSIKNAVITSETPLIVKEGDEVSLNLRRYRIVGEKDAAHIETQPQFTSSSMVEYFYSGGGRMLDCPAMHTKITGEQGEPRYANLMKGMYAIVSAYGVRALGGILPLYIQEMKKKINHHL